MSWSAISAESMACAIAATVLLATCQPSTVSAADAPPAAAPQSTTGSSDVPSRPSGKTWNVMDFRCDQMLGLADDDRAAAAMFYYGYMASSVDISTIDVSKIEDNVRRVMDRCGRTPDATVAAAFKEELGQSSR